MGARRGFAAIIGPRLPDYIPHRMRGMAMGSGPLRPVPTRCRSFVSVVHWNTLCTIILCAVLIVTANNVLLLIDYITIT